MKKLTLAVRIIAIIAGLLLLVDLVIHFGNSILYWNICRYFLMTIIIIAYISMMIQSYKAGNMRKLREMILGAVIFFMVSVLVYFLS